MMISTFLYVLCHTQDARFPETLITLNRMAQVCQGTQ